MENNEENDDINDNQLIELREFTALRGQLRINHNYTDEEIKSFHINEKTDYLGQFFDLNNNFKIEMNKNYTFSGLFLRYRKIIIFPNTKVPISMLSDVDISCANFSLDVKHGFFVMLYPRYTDIVSILHIVKLCRDEGKINCICECVGRGILENVENHRPLFLCAIRPFEDVDYSSTISLSTNLDSNARINPLLYSTPIIKLLDKSKLIRELKVLLI